MAQHAEPMSPVEQGLAAQGYTALPEFALIDECEFFDRKTNQHVKLDRTRLEKMAAAKNARIVGRNIASPCIVGHTKDHIPEEEQPEIVGYVTRFQVKNLPDGTAAIFGRPWAKPGHEQTFRDHPRRSVELWLDPDDIDPIALLGASTPRRDLPLHLFSRSYEQQATKNQRGSAIHCSRSQAGPTSILFELGSNMPFPPEDDKPTDTPDAGASSDAPGSDAPTDAAAPDWAKELIAQVKQMQAELGPIKEIFSQLEQEAMGGAGGDPTGGPPPGAGGPPPGMDPIGGAGGPPPGPGGPPPGPGGPPLPDRDDGPIKKNSGSAFGGGNSYMPTNHFSRAGYDPFAGHDMVIENEQLRAQMAQMQAALQQNQHDMAALKLAKLETEVDTELNKLKAEGYALVEDLDRPRLLRMSAKDRDIEIKLMRQTRAKAAQKPPLPGGGNPVINRDELVKQLAPVKFDRATGGIPGDPELPGLASIPDDYDALADMAVKAQRAGQDPKSVFSVTGLRSQVQNGVKVQG